MSRKQPRLPEFAPLDQLAPGQPMNPYKLLVGFEARRSILAFRKLGQGGKNLWLLLADECFSSGHDRQTQEQLAGKLGVTTRQLRRYLVRLKKHHLVHVEPQLGRQDFHWLLFHSVFAGCSPLTPDNSVLRVRTETSGGSGQERPPQRNYQRNYQRSGRGTGAVGTSNEGSRADLGEELAKNGAKGENHGELPITESSSPLRVSKEAKAFWFSLTPFEKSRRFSLAERVADRIDHYRQYLSDTHPEIVRQARHEIERHSNELRSLGFFVQSPNGETTPWTKTHPTKSS